MTCSQCQGIEQEFNRKHALEQLKKYRRKGAADTTRQLIAALLDDGVDGMTLLDIGGGVGAIQHALLKAGISRAADVDASPAYLEVARQEAQRQNFADRMSFYQGNFVDLAPTLPPADIVTLDRVICCYDDMQALVSLSARRARRMYGLVYPRDTWWVKLLIPIGNLYLRLRRSPFRAFAHSTQAVDAIARGQGLHQKFYRKMGFWQVVVYAS
ncbi:MAG TPA: methyltransferase domain-containing protein [Anaerolineales bacterium]|nr:methyltransferase domain-containing protein [Anaerolineales bacterium]